MVYRCAPKKESKRPQSETIKSHRPGNIEKTWPDSTGSMASENPLSMASGSVCKSMKQVGVDSLLVFLLQESVSILSKKNASKRP